MEARILGPCDGPPPDPSVTPLGNSIPTANNGSVAAIAPDPAAALRTIRALRDEDFDVIHVHEPLAPGPSLTAMVAGGGAKVGTWHRSGPSTWVTSLAPLGRWACRSLSVRAAVSEEARETAAAALGGDYELVWNGIDTDRYRLAPAEPAERPTILFVGRHEPRKGLAVLVDALELLPADLSVWVVGQGPETERLKRATAGDGRVEWLGSIPEDEKIRRIRGASLLCVPSLHGESFGVVLLEGMAAGTPVVASDIAGYRNVARPGLEARMVAPGDPGALAKAIEATLERGPETEQMVRSGLERAERFSMESLARRYVELYERALGS